MSRKAVVYICQECGARHSKWSGKCDSCGAWNSLSEESPAENAAPRAWGGGRARSQVPALELVGLPQAGGQTKAPRAQTGIHELDRVLGGGLVPGSAILIGGDPGIGKSTLLMQAAAALGLKGTDVLYVSGEEALDQLHLRADRLGLAQAPVTLAAGTEAERVLASLDTFKQDKGHEAGLAVIDSIQTLHHSALDGAPGTVGQIRACADLLIRRAKTSGTALILVGHVTKEGVIAGPRVLEHMVDAVLYFEGERGHPFRILRCVKNRFGPTDEIGVFEMEEQGLQEIPNPSALFLSQNGDLDQVAGRAVLAGMEGTRPMMVEIQALVAPAPYGSPRRAVVGWDPNRLAMLLAVLEARCGLQFSGMDVYLNIAGGLRIHEPAADLAVAAALWSALTDRAVPANTVFFGEVGLGGEVRSVSHRAQRLKEASKLGFQRAVGPVVQGRKQAETPDSLAFEELARLARMADLWD